MANGTGTSGPEFLFLVNMAAKESLFEISDGLSPAINSLMVLGELRGKELAGGMRWIMREWVKEAIDSIPVGSRGRILADLQRRLYASRRKGSEVAKIDPFATTLKDANIASRTDRWRGTLGAAIVAIYNIGGARGKEAPAFYAAVNRWAQNKAFGANLHRAGLQQARRELHIAAGADPAKLRSAPGEYRETLQDEAAEMLAANWASAAGPDALGIDKMAPTAFSGTMNKAVARFEVHYLKILNRTAHRAGFEVFQNAA